MAESGPQFHKAGVGKLEAEVQQRASELLPEHVPRVIAYDAALMRLSMPRVIGDTLADYYGDDCNATPEWVWSECRRLVMTLYEDGIVYPDITSYNFMIDAKTDAIWIIDFGHCTTRAPGPFTSGAPAAEGEHWFVRAFIQGDSRNEWNEDFA